MSGFAVGLDTNKQSNILPLNVTNMLHSNIQKAEQKTAVQGWKFQQVQGWRLKLTFKIEAMLRELGKRTGDLALIRRAGKMGICANTIRVKKEKETERIYASGIRCHDRICPVCNAFRAGKLAKKIEKLFDTTLKNPHLLTITYGLPVQILDLKENLDLFYEKLKKIRRLKWWKLEISGGIFFNEVTYKKGRGWHLHSHFIVDLKDTKKKVSNLEGEYSLIKVTEFKKQLELACEKEGLGKISDVRPCDEKASKELSKYFYKIGIDFDRENDWAIQELIQSFKNRRIFGTFGVCRGKQNDDDLDKELEEEKGFDDLGSVNDIVLKFKEDSKKWFPVLSQLMVQGFIGEIQDLDVYFESGEKLREAG